MSKNIRPPITDDEVQLSPIVLRTRIKILEERLDALELRVHSIWDYLGPRGWRRR